MGALRRAIGAAEAHFRTPQITRALKTPMVQSKYGNQRKKRGFFSPSSFFQKMKCLFMKICIYGSEPEFAYIGGYYLDNSLRPLQRSCWKAAGILPYMRSSSGSSSASSSSSIFVLLGVMPKKKPSSSAYSVMSRSLRDGKQQQKQLVIGLIGGKREVLQPSVRCLPTSF